MNKYIIDCIKSQIEEKQMFWASNYVAGKFQEGIDTPAAKVEVETAKHNMEEATKTIAWLENLLAEESK